MAIAETIEKLQIYYCKICFNGSLNLNYEVHHIKKLRHINFSLTYLVLSKYLRVRCSYLVTVYFLWKLEDFNKNGIFLVNSTLGNRKRGNLKLEIQRKSPIIETTFEH